MTDSANQSYHLETTPHEIDQVTTSNINVRSPEKIFASQSIEKSSDKRTSQLENRLQASGIRTSLRRISQFYESNSRILTSNYAGAEDDSQSVKSGEVRSPFMDESGQGAGRNLNLSSTSAKYREACAKGELGFWPTLFTFIKVNIVAGFLFLPAGFNNGGWLFSIIAIFCVSAIMIYCNIAISDCTDAAESFSFSRIGYKAAGKVGYYMVEIGIAISQICFPCSYSNLITQIVNNMINLWFGTKNNYYLEIAIVLGVILIPMCLVRNINKFSAMHIIGDIAVLATVFSLAYESISNISKDENFNYDNVKMFNTHWAKLLGMIITSLEGIGVILPIKENMKEKKKFNLVIIIGTFVISLILAGFPLIMYLCYQDKVNEIVLNNLPLDKVYIQIVLMMLMFSILIIYPVVLFPAFIILESIFFKNNKQEKLRRLSNFNQQVQEKAPSPQGDNTNTNGNRSSSEMSENILRIIIVICTIIVGVVSINRFDTLLALAGCGVCTPVALIFPSIFHYLLYKDKQSKMRNFFDLFIAGVGVSLSLTILFFTLKG
jgi:solute carrier family 36 (proton-coupled amino acid transporter)